MVRLLLFFLALASLPARAAAQDLRIGILDFYGLNHITVEQARAASGLTEGDPATINEELAPAITDAEKRLAALPGVRAAHMNVVCCDQGHAIVFGGIEERGSRVVRFRNNPRGAIRLPADIIALRDEWMTAFSAGVVSDELKEDDSQGHALFSMPAMQPAQNRFQAFAIASTARLREVLHHSSDDAHRALAAQILAYAPDKRTVIPDLVFAMTDPSPHVRNDAMRALGIIAKFSAAHPELRLRVPMYPFIALLNSPIWTDRNKASSALMPLSASRDPALFERLRRNSLDSLVNMACWKSAGHAQPALRILGRMGGMREDEIDDAFARDDRRRVLESVLHFQAASQKSLCR